MELLIGDRSARRDPADPVLVRVGETNIPVVAEGQVERTGAAAVERGAPRRGYGADALETLGREPHSSVRTLGDRTGAAQRPGRHVLDDMARVERADLRDVPQRVVRVPDLPVRPAATSTGASPDGSGNSMMWPVVAILRDGRWHPPRTTSARWVQLIPAGSEPGLGSANSRMTPAGVMRPIAPTADSVNHRFPSGPASMEEGPASDEGSGNGVTSPARVMRPITPAVHGVNQKAPSDPRQSPAASCRCGAGRGRSGSIRRGEPLPTSPRPCTSPSLV